MCLIALTTSAFAAIKQARLGASTFPFSMKVDDAKTLQPANVGDANSSSSQPVNQSALSNGLTKDACGPIPQFAVYRQLFHHFVSLNKKADEMDQRGQNGAPLRTFYKRQARLDEQQAKALEKISFEIEAEAEKLDRQARKLIKASMSMCNSI